MEKAIYKGTRKDLDHPKLKHVQALVSMSWSGMSAAEFFFLINERFRELNWVIAMKSLVIIHIIMHDGNGEAFYQYVASQPDALELSRFRDRNGARGIEQSKNVRFYAIYLRDKAFAFKSTRMDYLLQNKPKGSQIYASEVSDVKLLLLELSTIQKQLHSLLKCQFETSTLDNDCTFSAFRYCLRDLLKLYQAMNEGAIKCLKEFFSMKDEDMRRALDLYKRYVRLTERTVSYMAAARKFEPILGITIPELLHVPLTLLGTLENHLNLNDNEKAVISEELKEYKKVSNKASASSRKASQTATNYHRGGRPMLKLKPELLGLTKNTSSLDKTQQSNASTVKNAQFSAAAATQPIKKISDDNLIDFFSHIDESINTPGNNIQGYQTGNEPFMENQTQLNFAISSLDNNNNFTFTPQQYQSIISGGPASNTPLNEQQIQTIQPNLTAVSSFTSTNPYTNSNISQFDSYQNLQHSTNIANTTITPISANLTPFNSFANNNLNPLQSQPQYHSGPHPQIHSSVNTMGGLNESSQFIQPNGYKHSDTGFNTSEGISYNPFSQVQPQVQPQTQMPNFNYTQSSAIELNPFRQTLAAPVNIAPLNNINPNNNFEFTQNQNSVPVIQRQASMNIFEEFKPNAPQDIINQDITYGMNNLNLGQNTNQRSNAGTFGVNTGPPAMEGTQSNPFSSLMATKTSAVQNSNSPFVNSFSPGDTNINTNQTTFTDTPMSLSSNAAIFYSNNHAGAAVNNHLYANAAMQQPNKGANFADFNAVFK
ncbi:hypothetical protein BB561_004529 [Smittium simulii]|uniref:ENTH domain-containing protein n=1 Tax=Smittium simulii TaxID=133385 RepID=A0A2T9YFR9_9FUNG|nr:hypothetical protein BB561_004529 [Smittium simulii]